jgi:prevent-host-death family protein
MDRETDRWVRSDEARAKLRDLLDEIAADGAHVYVLRYDKPAAVLVPVEWYERMRGIDTVSDETDT